ncbi:hypothetical protein HDU98_006677 [Podochytrium sp. JEL0797]|nr:hypothetical protein HDU98_006677 [Podochytrium sp. JEL0797]
MTSAANHPRHDQQICLLITYKSFSLKQNGFAADTVGSIIGGPEQVVEVSRESISETSMRLIIQPQLMQLTKELSASKLELQAKIRFLELKDKESESEKRKFLEAINLLTAERDFVLKDREAEKTKFMEEIRRLTLEKDIATE